MTRANPASRAENAPEGSDGPAEESGSEWPLCAQFGLSHTSILERHTFLRVHGNDEANMAFVRRVMEARVDEIIEQFYAHLASFPPLVRHLKDARTISRLKRTQRDYLLGMGRDSAGLDYVEYRLRVGVAHDRVNLEPRWFVSAYAILFDLVADHIARDAAAQDADPVPLLRSLSKVFWLDAGLAVDTYHGAAIHRAAVSVQ